METETNSAVLRRLLARGGHILVVGGEMKDLPDKYHQHPQILVWDDNERDFSKKQIPTNTRGIAFNRWISHGNAKRLRLAANQLKIPCFPLLRKKEVMDILNDLISSTETSPVVAAPEVKVEPLGVVDYETIPMPEIEEEVSKGYLTNEEMMRPPKRGEMTHDILPKELKDNEGPAQSAKRLMPIIKEKYGIKMTQAALQQAIIKCRSILGEASSKKEVTKSAPEKAKPTLGAKIDDFDEAEKLLKDARAAIDLFINYLPKLRKQQHDLTRRQAKIRELLGE